MRTLVLLFLLALCVNAGFFDTKFGKHLKKLANKIKDSFNTTAMLRIREKIDRMTEKIKKKLTLRPEQKAILGELLKRLNPLKTNNSLDFSIQRVNERSGVGQLLYQGDIALREEQFDSFVTDEFADNDDEGREKRQAAFRNQYYPLNIWSEGIDYYFHSSSTRSVRSVFKKAAEAWQKDTCIDFRENSRAEHRVRVTVQTGCWSMIGRDGGEQDLSLGKDCDNIGTAAHEIGHAIGLLHTHSRHDRDNYVTLNTRNIQPGWMSEFAKQSRARNENYGMPYDYGSIMHYPAYGPPSINGQPTMLPHDPAYMESLGSPLISFLELLIVNKHYGCTKICESARSSANCQMGGFPHPRDCSKCVCPSGYGGRLCNERPSGCGKVVEASSSPQTIVVEAGDRRAGQRFREDMTICNYWIKAPEGSKIEVKITEMPNGLATHGCQAWGVEIKTHSDPRFTGYRFCAEEDVGVTMMSKTNIVPVVIYNRYYITQVKIEYRIVSGNRPQPPPSAPQGSRCEDKPECSALLRTRNFCRSNIFKLSVKRAICPKLCGFC